MIALSISRYGYHERGFSYAEVLVAITLVAVTLIPTLEALQTGIQGAGIHESHTVNQHQLFAKMEEVLAEPIEALDAAAQAAGNASTPTNYSDTAGTPNRRLVFLSRYDGDNADADDDPFTDVDDGFIWVRVEIEATVHTMETLTNNLN